MEENNTYKANMIGVYKDYFRLFRRIFRLTRRTLMWSLTWWVYLGMIVVLRFALGGLSGEIEPESGFSMLSFRMVLRVTWNFADCLGPAITTCGCDRTGDHVVCRVIMWSGQEVELLQI